MVRSDFNNQLFGLSANDVRFVALAAKDVKLICSTSLHIAETESAVLVGFCFRAKLLPIRFAVSIGMIERLDFCCWYRPAGLFINDLSSDDGASLELYLHRL